MKVGTFFTVFFQDLQLNQVHIRIRGEGYEKIFSLPTQLRKLITTDIFQRLKMMGWIKDREYCTFEIVNILTKDGEEVNKLQ